MVLSVWSSLCGPYGRLYMVLSGWSSLYMVLSGWSSLYMVLSGWSSLYMVLSGWSSLYMVLSGWSSLYMVLSGWSSLYMVLSGWSSPPSRRRVVVGREARAGVRPPAGGRAPRSHGGRHRRRLAGRRQAGGVGVVGPDGQPVRCRDGRDRPHAHRWVARQTLRSATLAPRTD